MSNEDSTVYDTTEVGVQNDGEPAVVEAAPEVEAVETVEDAPEAVEAAEPEDGEGKPHKKNGSQRWKDKALREAEEKEYWKTRALQGSEAPKPASVAELKPQLDQFETHSEWVEAVTDWKVEQKLSEREAKAKATAAQQTWQEKAKAAQAKYEDFDDALNTATGPSQAVFEVIHESPAGADLAYHLATHPDEYARINKLSPTAAARELGLIEARMTVKAAPTPKLTTKAPKPLTPVTSASAAKPVSDGSYESY